MAGIDVPSQKERMERHLSAKGFSNCLVFNDAFLGVKAACPRGYGVSFVNGTGNSVGGIDQYGNWLQVGGTGDAFGDLGGAPGMTKAIICAVYSSFYRCGPKTMMSKKFFSLLGIDDPSVFTQTVYEAVYSENISHREIHNDVLYAAANDGDNSAIALLCSFGKQFALSIAGCINNLRFDEQHVDIALIGSATLKARSPVMIETCKAETERLTGKKVILHPLTTPPAVGAVLWAIELATDANNAMLVHDVVVKNFI